jgi:acyl carrier protein
LNDLRLKVIEQLRAIAPDADPTALGPDEDLRDALDLDSMDFLRFVTALHRELGVDVPERDYPRLRTLRGALEYLGGAPH